jgi:hypothetical protein
VDRWDPHFDRDREVFAPLASAMEPFRRHTSWPTLDEWNAAFPPLLSTGGAPIRFVPQPPKRRAGPVDIDAIYDERIFTRGEVPSRATTWHDFFNMLVWATFPATKRAINARQRAALRARVHPGMERLPGARTREQDMLAMLDEGGALQGDRLWILGHAIYEHLVTGQHEAKALIIDVRAATLAQADRALAGELEGGAMFTLDRPATPIVG